MGTSVEKPAITYLLRLSPGNDEESGACLRSFFQDGDMVNVTMIEMLRVHPGAPSLKSLEDRTAYVEGV